MKVPVLLVAAVVETSVHSFALVRQLSKDRKDGVWWILDARRNLAEPLSQDSASRIMLRQDVRIAVTVWTISK